MTAPPLLVIAGATATGKTGLSIRVAEALRAAGVGAEIIAPMAVPVLGGLLISDEVVDIFLPVRFYWVRRARWLKLHPEVGQDN